MTKDVTHSSYITYGTKGKRYYLIIFLIVELSFKSYIYTNNIHIFCFIIIFMKGKTIEELKILFWSAKIKLAFNFLLVITEDKTLFPFYFDFLNRYLIFILKKWSRYKINLGENCKIVCRIHNGLNWESSNIFLWCFFPF